MGPGLRRPLTNREFFLVEYRRREGNYYDRNLPGEGLLIWHVGERKNVENFPVREYDVVLEAPHGRMVIDAATRYQTWTCWPKPRQRCFTPETWPSTIRGRAKARSFLK